MGRIGGNIYGTLQVKNTKGLNYIGEAVTNWVDAVTSVYGWLDLTSGDSKYSTYKAKIEESTHTFLCDYNADVYSFAGIDTRMVFKGFVYDVLLIDNPMELNDHLEIYLKRVGAWNG